MAQASARISAKWGRGTALPHFRPFEYELRVRDHSGFSARTDPRISLHRSFWATGFGFSGPRSPAPCGPARVGYSSSPRSSRSHSTQLVSATCFNVSRTSSERIVSSISIPGLDAPLLRLVAESLGQEDSDDRVHPIRFASRRHVAAVTGQVERSGIDAARHLERRQRDRKSVV